MEHNIGTGSVTTMAKAGAECGMELFAVLLLPGVFIYILMVAKGKLTLVPGNTTLFNTKI